MFAYCRFCPPPKLGSWTAMVATSMKKSNPVGLFNIENGTSGMKKHLDAEHPEACKRFHLENPTIANRQSKLALAPRKKWKEKGAPVRHGSSVPDDCRWKALVQFYTFTIFSSFCCYCLTSTYCPFQLFPCFLLNFI